MKRWKKEDIDFELLVSQLKERGQHHLIPLFDKTGVWQKVHPCRCCGADTFVNDENCKVCGKILPQNDI